jgi:hypothetical protein
MSGNRVWRDRKGKEDLKMTVRAAKAGDYLCDNSECEVALRNTVYWRDVGDDLECPGTGCGKALVDFARWNEWKEQRPRRDFPPL